MSQSGQKPKKNYILLHRQIKKYPDSTVHTYPDS